MEVNAGGGRRVAAAPAAGDIRGGRVLNLSPFKNLSPSKNLSPFKNES